ncbi:MAG: hypothetical protein AVDCRST_MAG87-428 [uncultured Thermomicrobiales bacterium]|uniref:Aminoglycoside phosphotransferase domain-containing protein n=1 Tax=uncultured Thermomicrobiales bacterium TaxID=1645740 RepID=A0A6J4UEG8_9BACT|nr:MAG: hypothetical protein AVDCRST_MAG87-428 [uncultured Thermomicrobiales bacterium]
MIPDVAHLDVRHLRAILAEYDPRADLVRIDRPGSGISNQVLFLTTTRDDLVLRVFADDLGTWKPQKERKIYGHMASLGIPVPFVHTVDASRQVVPFAYSLAARLEGEPYSAVCSSLTDTENVAIHATLGDFLGRLHTTTFDRFGDVDAGADGLVVGPAYELAAGGSGQTLGPFATWREMHDALVTSRLRLMRGTPFEDLIPVVEAYVVRHRDIIDREVTPRLLHMDLHRGNVLVANGRVTGVLDVEEAIVGHNEYDLMRTELATIRGQPPAFAEAFMGAYEAHVPLDEGYETRKDFYDVSRTLVWIRSLILHGDAYASGLESQSHRAARAHLLGLAAASQPETPQSRPQVSGSASTR